MWQRICIMFYVIPAPVGPVENPEPPAQMGCAIRVGNGFRRFGNAGCRSSMSQAVSRVAL